MEIQALQRQPALLRITAATGCPVRANRFHRHYSGKSALLWRGPLLETQTVLTFLSREASGNQRLLATLSVDCSAGLGSANVTVHPWFAALFWLFFLFFLYVFSSAQPYPVLRC